MSPKRAIAVCLCLAASAMVGACGGETTSPGYGTYAGVYALDMDRTLAASGKPLMDPAVRARLAETKGEDIHRLELRTDGSFTLRVGSGASAFVTNGRWTQSMQGIELTTLTGDGLPAPDGTKENAEIDGDHLVLHEGEETLYLRRL
jgi:hypothetical protein